MSETHPMQKCHNESIRGQKLKKKRKKHVRTQVTPTPDFYIGRVIYEQSQSLWKVTFFISRYENHDKLIVVHNNIHLLLISTAFLCYSVLKLNTVRLILETTSNSPLNLKILRLTLKSWNEN